MAVYTDDFNRANAGTLGANWATIINGGHKIVSNQAVGNTGATLEGSVWSANAFADSHYAQVVENNAANFHTGPCVRGQAGKCYFYLNDGQVGKDVSGVFTNLGNRSAGNGTGHTLRLEASGTTYTPYFDGAAEATFSDAAISGGGAGLYTYNGSTAQTESWEGGDLGGDGGDTTARLIGGDLFNGGLLFGGLVQ